MCNFAFVKKLTQVDIQVPVTAYAEPSGKVDDDAYAQANVITTTNERHHGRSADDLLDSLATTSWTSSPDAATWTFKIRKGVEFQNGRTLTVQNVIASINYHRGEKSTSIAKPLVASVTDIRAEGDDRVGYATEDTMLTTGFAPGPPGMTPNGIIPGSTSSW